MTIAPVFEAVGAQAIARTGPNGVAPAIEQLIEQAINQSIWQVHRFTPLVSVGL
jgi:hypothetical protein